MLSWVVVDASVLELSKAINAAFAASARRDWDVAGEVLRGLVGEDDVDHAVRNSSFVHSCVAWRVLLT